VFCVLKIAANRLDIPVSLSVVLLRMSLIKVKVSRHDFCAAHANLQTVAHQREESARNGEDKSVAELQQTQV